ncbi:uncharacterized protein LOC122506171 [Leptopilina heterotoma]|uniref:uncharacterized protein LOC122506171 n=1 Tax=Leptopilina heterotoma TaxID=63436 RepID=UPI001CA7F510|nr:uncharacterized protein LOC122506171 [Leptopilina heterotoma]
MLQSELNCNDTKMQKAICFFIVLFAIVAMSFAHHGHRHDGPMPNPPPTPPTQEIENESSNHRVVREMPNKMPSMEEIKQFAEEQISKLPQPMQDTIYQAQEMIAKNMNKE